MSSAKYLRWSPLHDGYDIHVLYGKASQPLANDLYLLFEDSSQKPVCANQPPSGIKISFKPLLTGDQQTHGVGIDPQTGAITVAKVGTGALRNFLLQATATDETNPNKAPINAPLIRVHIHTSVSKCWLTPSTLTIKEDATKAQHFTVLAQFDDGVIGDVTRQHGISWTCDSALVSLPLDDFVSTNDFYQATYQSHRVGDIYVTASEGSAQITAKLPANLGSKPTESAATIYASPSWSTPLRAEWVAGAGPAKTSQVKNFLFLSDGFKEDEKDKFAEIVLEIVNTLRNSQVTSPYNLLFRSFNFWRAFLPSREHGTSVLHELIITITDELILLMKGDGYYATSIPNPRKPPADGSPWKLEHLIYEVGLPRPADANADFASKKNEWVTFYPNIKDNSVNDDVFKKWRSLSGHFLVNERDTIFGMCWGGRPRFPQDEDPRSATWNPLRAARSDVNKLLENLTNNWGVASLGHIWLEHEKDHIIILCSGGKYGGVHNSIPDSEHIAVGLPMLREVKLDLLFNIFDDEVKSRVTLASTVAHEISHSFRLKDEYGGSEDPVSNSQVQQSAFWPNVQVQAELLTDGKLDGEKIKWLWPRIAKAGMLREPPKVTTVEEITLVELLLEPGHAEKFRQSEIVRLRQSSKSSVANFRTPSMEYLEIESVDYDQDILYTMVKRMKVLPYVTPELKDYPVGSIVYMPVTEPPGTSPLNDDAECLLVHPKVKQHISASGLPLNATPPKQGDPPYQCVEDTRKTQDALNWPAGIAQNVKPEWSGYLVGLYDGGATYDCGAYHPTGECIMRSVKEPDSQRLLSLCPVCRYYLVDIIDPKFHTVLDDWYSRRYPPP